MAGLQHSGRNGAVRAADRARSGRCPCASPPRCWRHTTTSHTPSARVPASRLNQARRALAAIRRRPPLSPPAALRPRVLLSCPHPVPTLSAPADKMMGLSDNTKIGVLMISLGFLFLFLGVLLFFDAGLMAIGEASTWGARVPRCLGCCELWSAPDGGAHRPHDCAAPCCAPASTDVVASVVNAHDALLRLERWMPTAASERRRGDAARFLAAWLRRAPAAVDKGRAPCASARVSGSPPRQLPRAPPAPTPAPAPQATSCCCWASPSSSASSARWCSSTR